MVQKSRKPLFQVIKVIKDLIGILYMHIVWNVHFEAVSLRKEEKRRHDIPTYCERGA